MNKHPLPQFVARYFWGDSLEELDAKRHMKYIIQVLLERGDRQSIRWLLSTYNRLTIKEVLQKIRLSKKSANFWHVYFSS